MKLIGLSENIGTSELGVVGVGPRGQVGFGSCFFGKCELDVGLSRSWKPWGVMVWYGCTENSLRVLP